MTGKVREFTEVDPFNPQNTITGTISIFKMNDGYGSLSIHSVNGVQGMKHQKIPATPKMQYPEYVSTYGKSNKFFHSREKEVHDIQAYEKLDGSNIFGFVYHDANGVEFVSYKLRLRPFLTNSKFGNFYDLFNSIKPEGLDEYILNSGYNLSMELWGKANPHLIHYPNVDLQLTVLFGRERGYNHYVTPPMNLPQEGFNFNIPLAWGTSSSEWTYNDLVHFYTTSQKVIEDKLQPYSANKGEEPTQFIGNEGLMLYVQEMEGPSNRSKISGNWTPYKLKPHSIEEIHWAAGSDSGISNEVLRATSLKAIEAYDDPTEDDVITLLSEDWGEVAIGLARNNIGPILNSTKDEILFNNRIWNVYNEVIGGVNDIKDRGAVLKAMSPHFGKSQMTMVYSAIKNVVN